MQNPWTINSKTVKYENAWIKLTEFDVINPSGGKGIYGKIHFKNTATGIVAMDDEKNIWLVGQYRFPLNEYSWEIPEGGALIGADPLEGAKRELLEETGLKAAHWQLLLRMHLSNSVSDEEAFVYLATGLSFHEAEPEETEELSLKKMPLDEAWLQVERGEITDSMTVAAIAKVKLMLLGGQL